MDSILARGIAKSISPKGSNRTGLSVLNWPSLLELIPSEPPWPNICAPMSWWKSAGVVVPVVTTTRNNNSVLNDDNIVIIQKVPPQYNKEVWENVSPRVIQYYLEE
jgi:hypothetical protein